MTKLRLKKNELEEIKWNDLVSDLVENCCKYHSYFYSTNYKNNFKGPIIHFHTRALSSEGQEKLEMTYAMLVAWGMHRMGGGAQMNDYATFIESSADLLMDIEQFKDKTIETITDFEFINFEIVFNKLKPMYSNKKIVAFSKVMAHYLPNIIAPIDNEYTFHFICQQPRRTYPPRNWSEFDLFKEIHIKLIKNVVSNYKFKEAANHWLNNNEFQWDTSLPKIVDNLIIGKIKNLKQTDERYKKKVKIN
jgi:hypothetical protein